MQCMDPVEVVILEVEEEVGEVEGLEVEVMEEEAEEEEIVNSR